MYRSQQNMELRWYLRRVKTKKQFKVLTTFRHLSGAYQLAFVCYEYYRSILNISSCAKLFKKVFRRLERRGVRNRKHNQIGSCSTAVIIRSARILKSWKIPRR